MPRTSQRPIQNEPIFRLLLKVAVKRVHHCEFRNFSWALPTDRAAVLFTAAPECQAARDGRQLPVAHSRAYLLGLLAMIKCSICSYQYDN